MNAGLVYRRLPLETPPEQAIGGDPITEPKPWRDPWDQWLCPRACLVMVPQVQAACAYGCTSRCMRHIHVYAECARAHRALPRSCPPVTCGQHDTNTLDLTSLRDESQSDSEGPIKTVQIESECLYCLTGKRFGVTIGGPRWIKILVGETQPQFRGIRYDASYESEPVLARHGHALFFTLWEGGDFAPAGYRGWQANQWNNFNRTAYGAATEERLMLQTHAQRCPQTGLLEIDDQPGHRSLGEGRYAEAVRNYINNSTPENLRTLNSIAPPSIYTFFLVRAGDPRVCDAWMPRSRPHFKECCVGLRLEYAVDTSALPSQLQLVLNVLVVHGPVCTAGIGEACKMPGTPGEGWQPSPIGFPERLTARHMGGGWFVDAVTGLPSRRS